MRRRPGMYTHTQRPNHLAHEVVDNSVVEATSGYCNQIDVTLFKDGSLEVSDNARGMPVDIHPQEKVQRCGADPHAAARRGKFSEKAAYKFSGGLHGVGRLGGQCPELAPGTAPSAAAARNTGSPSRTAR